MIDIKSIITQKRKSKKARIIIIFNPLKDKQNIIAFNSGIYSKQVPVIPVCIVVKHADDISIVVETYYLIFGHTEMLIGDDGPTYLRTLF